MTDDFRNLNTQVTSQYDEWWGTAAADDRSPIAPDMYEVAGLPHDEWHIIGFEVYPLNPDHVTVFAERKGDLEYDRGESPEGWHMAWRQAVADHGSVPVHQFEVYAESNLIEKIFKRFSVRLFTHSVAKHQMPVKKVGHHEGTGENE